MKRIFKIILPIKINRSFFYIGSNDIEAGDMVLVPFGTGIRVGLVWEEVTEIDFPEEKLKTIKERLVPKLYNKNYREFLLYFAVYNLTTLGQTLKLILPNIKILSHKPKFINYVLSETGEPQTTIKNQVEGQKPDKPTNRTNKKRAVIKKYFEQNDLKEIQEKELIENLGLTKSYLTTQVKKGFLLKSETSNRNDTQQSQKIHYNQPDFSDTQQKTISQIKDSILQEKFKVGFLNGVTGSGKTEIYFSLIAQILETPSTQILVLLPEILLTKQFIDKFYKRFGFVPQIWHSQTTEKDKKRIWHDVVNGNIRFLVGARSALFLPFKNLGLIILDEEHEISYKQEDNLIYHARDMAVARSYKENIPILLVSATPSLETKINIINGKYQEFTLEERYGVATLPEVQLIDMKKEMLKSHKSISNTMLEEIKKCLFRKEQILIFLNRRGYAPLKICNSCGYRYQCDNCDASMVEHRAYNQLLCHHCGHTKPLVNICPKCKTEDSLVSYGFGIERVKEELEEYFPDSKIAMITSDESKDLGKVKQIFQDIEENKYDIIIGTQILSKGHHFANLTLACVLDGDIGNEVQDLRCTERMFQILHQISGRVGRAEKTGKALIQTYNPDSNFLQAIISNNIEEFYKYEISKRKQFLLPPFSQFIALIVSDEDKDRGNKAAMDLAKLLKKQENITVYGPAPAPIFFLRNKYRFRILLKLAKNGNKGISGLKRDYVDIMMESKVNIKIDVDPQSFI